MNRLMSGASLSFVACALMVMTSFVAMSSTPANEAQLLAEESALTNRLGGADVSLNAEITDPDAKLDPRLDKSMRESRGPFEVYLIVDDREAANDILASKGLGLIRGQQVAGIPDVSLMELDGKTIRLLAESPGVTKILQYQAPEIEPSNIDLAREDFQTTAAPAVEDYDVDVVHGAVESWDMGFTGEGVKVAVIDDGFDLAHPDMQGIQARYESGLYAGWPMAYDDYAASKWANGKIGGWMADTSTIVAAKNKKSGSIAFDGATYIIKGLMDINGNLVKSKSGEYHIGYHPDPFIGQYVGGDIAVLVVDSKVKGVYDTVYVDVMRDFSFANDKPCTMGDEISYFDFYDATTGLTDTSMWNAGDGFADYSGSMIYWIADGETVYPASDWMYGAEFVGSAGGCVAFMGAYAGSHGTMTSGSALAVGRTMGGQLGGMAQDAKLMAVPFTGSTVNAWKYVEYGVDGVLGTGDEADICTNSYGWSDTAIDAGYNILDMIMMTISLSGDTMWFWSAGNGGPGYGTTHSITDFTSVHVGAGTTMQYRYLMGYEMAPGLQKWGDVIPFSNAGPGKTGKVNTEIIASGAYSLEPAPLNMDATDSSSINTVPGNGAAHNQIGSGTSHATPTTAGGAALGFQAYFETHGEFPASDYAKAVLMGAADDMHFDPFKQGAGWLNAATFCKLMSGGEATVSFAQGENFATSALYPGDVYGQVYEAFPNFMLPGAVDTELVTTYNTGAEDRTVTVSSELLLKTSSSTISTTTRGNTEQYIDITSLVPEGTDLLKATMYVDMAQFDPELDTVENFEYWLELHDWVDLNGNGNLDAQVKSPSVWELFRFTVDGECNNYNTVMIKDPLERITDGLIVRVRPWIPAPGVFVTVQLDYYELQEFPWVKVREAGADTEFASAIELDVPAGGQVSWEAQVSVPDDAFVGTYGAGVYIRDDDRTQCMPIVINVPATDYEFEFGGESYFDTPYNNDVQGLSDKYWRYEVGDNRIFWVLPDPDSELPDGNAYLMVGAEWAELPTDINLHVLAPVAVDPTSPWMGVFSDYGPGYYETRIASSDERYMGAGVFAPYTNTGEAKEVIAAPIGSFMTDLGMPAPFAVITRCPLMAGHAASDAPTGFTKWVVMNGFGAEASSVGLSISKDQLSGTIPAWYDIAVDGTLEARGAGEPPMVKYFWPDEEIYPDQLSGNFDADLAAAVYTRPLTVANCNKLTVSVAPVSGADDIDLAVWYDSNLDGIADLTEPYWYVGTGGSFESLTLMDPADGQYLVKVLGYTISGDPGVFSLTVLQGVAGASMNAVLPEAVVDTGYHAFEIAYTMPAAEGVYIGSVTFGFMGAADMFKIEVLFTVTA